MDVGLDKVLFSDRVQYCSKCCRKLGADGKKLRKFVKAAIADAHGDDVALEKVDCFSLCPKGGQVVATVGARQRRVVIIEPGSDVKRTLAYLLE